MYHLKNDNRTKLFALSLLSSLMCAPFVHAELASDYVSIPPLINLEASGDKTNALFILDNSNSMDEAPSGQAVGSASPASKSEIARNAVKSVIDEYRNQMRVGLMAYRQSGINRYNLHDSQYDVSYDSDNYDSSYNGDRDSLTKKFRIPNPADSGNYIHYNVALPFYAGSNYGTAFCYSSTADFDNGSEDENSGPWDSYDCYSFKTGESDNFSGFSNYRFRSGFAPTDSDLAQNILDFGTHLTWQYVSRAWFANSSPGRGYLHVEVDDVDDAHYDDLFDKLATSQFSSFTDTPLRNAGLTPIEGTLQSAGDYFAGSLSSSESVTSSSPSAPPANTCVQDDIVILVTDGLPSVDASGNRISDTAAAIQAAANEAQDLLDQGVRTYVVGFALPNGVDASLLDTIAAAGGTESTYLADDPESLLAALRSIIAGTTREVSASSAAVISTDSQGEGALYRAIYSPQKEDVVGSEITWAGDLFGLFIDDNGLFREDTNGNDQLDSGDRVVQYFFDSTEDRARAGLYPGYTGAPPDLTVSPSSVVEVDGLSTIWSAKQQLSQVADVITQRPYGSPADEGRYIITSVDGENLLEFVQVSDEALEALVQAQTDAQTALDSVQADYDVAQAQYQGAVDAVDALESQRDDALATWQAAQTSVVAAETALTLATQTLADAEQALQDQVAVYNTAATDFIDNYEARADAIPFNTANFDQSLTDYDAATSESEFDTLITAVIDRGGDETDPAVVAALANLNDQITIAADARTRVSDELTGFENDFDSGSDQIQALLGVQNTSGSLTTVERSALDSAMSDLDSSLEDLVDASGSVDPTALFAAREQYYDALIATGVNPNPAAISGPRADYDAALAVQQQAYNDTQDSLTSGVVSVYEFYQQPNYNFLTQADAAQAADVARSNAQLAADAAAQVLSDAQEAEAEAEQAHTEAVAAYQGGVDFLTPAEESFRAIETIYNAALAAYNLATQNVNSSDTLLNYLDVGDYETAYDVVRFVRGQDGIDGMRSRAFDLTGDCQAGEDPDDPDDSCDLEVWRLGDIVHSSPALVAAPSEGYSSRYIDRSYAEFRRQYIDRRNVIYVGANDGMLHAFNAGFWDRDDKQFDLTNGSGVEEHPLGAELWAYIPRTALPHLQWMTDPTYAHSYYVDGSPLAFDANIFDDDETHPNGWGTVLVVGMRFGGGDIYVDSDGDGTDDAEPLRSSYILFDVTDPESPPVFLGEISHPQLGFTTSQPAVFKRRVAGEDFFSPSVNEWYLAFGSGPTELDDATSDGQNAGLFLFDLQTMSFESGFDPLDIGRADSFVGDIKVYDANNDYVDDVIYFGVVEGGPGSESGGLYRINLEEGASSASVLIDRGPVVAAPSVVRGASGRVWVNFGTGRLYMAEDNRTGEQNYFFGVMEPVDSSTGEITWTDSVSRSSDLQPVGNIRVLSSGDLNASVTVGSDSVDTFDQLMVAIRENRDGWYRPLAQTTGVGFSERSITESLVVRTTLLFSSYIPALNPCDPEGTSNLYGVDFRTGTAAPFDFFITNPDPTDYVEPYIDLGPGLATAPTVISGSGSGYSSPPPGGKDATVVVCLSGGDCRTLDAQFDDVPSGRQSWRQIFLD